jgi:beta-lactam-binding protein with PASTA domain
MVCGLSPASAWRIINAVTERVRERLSRLSSLALMIAILVIAGGISAITAMRLAIRGTEVQVPSLAGKTEEEARKILADSKLVLRVSTTRRYTPSVPAGHIVVQDPVAGANLKTSRSVKVLLSAGDQKYAVPNLVGSSLRAAKLTLAQRNFTLGNASVTRTGTGEPLMIQQQFPQPGSQQVADPAVNVLLSAGPIEQFFVMPDLVGKSADLVAGRARAEGFQLGKLTYRKYASVEPGVVTQQRPQAGHRLSKNDAILLEVSQ